MMHVCKFNRTFALMSSLLLDQVRSISFKTKLNTAIAGDEYSRCELQSPDQDNSLCWGYQLPSSTQSGHVSVAECSSNYDSAPASTTLSDEPQLKFCAARSNFFQQQKTSMNPDIDQLAQSLSIPNLADDAVAYKKSFCEWVERHQVSQAATQSLCAQGVPEATSVATTQPEAFATFMQQFAFIGENIVKGEATEDERRNFQKVNEKIRNDVTVPDALKAFFACTDNCSEKYCDAFKGVTSSALCAHADGESTAHLAFTLTAINQHQPVDGASAKDVKDIEKMIEEGRIPVVGGSMEKQEILLKCLVEIKERVEKTPETEGNPSVAEELSGCSHLQPDEIAKLTAQIEEELQRFAKQEGNG